MRPLQENMLWSSNERRRNVCRMTVSRGSQCNHGVVPAKLEQHTRFSVLSLGLASLMRVDYTDGTE